MVETPTIFGKKTYRNIALVVIIATLIIVGFLMNYGLKVRNDEYCNSDLLIHKRGSSLTTTPYPLNSEDSFLSAKRTFHYNDFSYAKDFEFCYSGTAFVTNTLKLNVIDQENNVLGSTYVNNGSVDECVSIINNKYITPINYYGLKCESCNATEYFVPNAYLLTSDEEIIYGNELATNKTTGKDLDYDIRYTSNCRKMFKDFVNAFFTITGLLIIIWLFILFAEFLRDSLWKGWF